MKVATFIFISYYTSERNLNLVLFLLHLAGNELAPNHLFLVSDFNKTPTHRRNVLLQNNLPFLAHGEAIPDG